MSLNNEWHRLISNDFFACQNAKAVNVRPIAAATAETVAGLFTIAPSKVEKNLGNANVCCYSFLFGCVAEV